jgi:DNA-binding NarL/FixJ family response regulator
MTIRVLIADDHPIIRSGVRSELSRDHDIQIVGEATNGDEALAKTRELKPDVLVLDIRMPGLNISSVLQQLKVEENPARILILSAFGDSGNVLGAINLGAQGYLLKDEAPAAIIQAVKAIANGEPWFSGSVRSIVNDHMQGKLRLPSEILTEREYGILKCIAEGLSNLEISEKLYVTERTVEFHISNLYRKIGVDTKVKAVLWAQENHVLDTSSNG